MVPFNRKMKEISLRFSKIEEKLSSAEDQLSKADNNADAHRIDMKIRYYEELYKDYSDMERFENRLLRILSFFEKKDYVMTALLLRELTSSLKQY